VRAGALWSGVRATWLCPGDARAQGDARLLEPAMAACRRSSACPGLRPQMILIGPSHKSSVVAGPIWATVCAGCPSAVPSVPRLKPDRMTNNMPKTTLVRGPTIVIRNSARGEEGSCWMLETPPKRNKVMLRTGTPFNVDLDPEYSAYRKFSAHSNSSEETTNA